MAVIYLRSTDGSDGDDGSTWALAKATLAAALTAAGVGGTVYVSDNHAETQATAMTLTSPGTAASPVHIYCVDDAAEPPTAMATTATVTTTGTASNITYLGFTYCKGVTFNCGTGGGPTNFIISSGTAMAWSFEDCAFKKNSTAAGTASIQIGRSSGDSDDNLVMFKNCVVQFGNTGDRINVRCPFIWTDTPSAISGATIPTTLFTFQNAGPGSIDVRGVDLSALGSGNLLDVSTAIYSKANFANCRLGTSFSHSTGSVAGFGGIELRVVNCDSGDTNYKYFKQNYGGTISHETVIVRTGGASDGTTPISRKMVSSANAKYYWPLVSDPIMVWNDTTGSSKTITVEVVTDNVTLTDAEMWIEVEKFTNGSYPISSTASDRSANALATPANQTSSSVTWTTTGLTTPVKQALAVTFTPSEKGLFIVRVCLAKASQTAYYCPLAVIS